MASHYRSCNDIVSPALAQPHLFLIEALFSMASCGGSCTSASPASLSWFKIDQAGLISGTLTTGTWGMGELVANNNSWTSTIPTSLKPGEYFFRNEVIFAATFQRYSLIAAPL